MTIDWVHLVFALILLWLPRPALRLGGRLLKARRKRRKRSDTFDPNPLQIREPGDTSVSFRIEFTKARNYIDLLRAALGSVILLGLAPVIEPAVHATGSDTIQIVFYGRLAVLIVAMLIQAFRFDHRVTMFAPLFFVAGVSIGLCGPYAAGFAFVLIWTVNLALPNPTAFLSVYSILILLFGMMFLGIRSPLPIFSAVLFFLPVLVSLLIRRPLVLFAKKSRTGNPATAT